MEKQIKYNNASINYTDKGEGDAIVLLHGFLESLKIWDDFSDELSKKFRVVCIDLPGFGKSDLIAEIHSMELYAEVVKSVLDNLQIKKCTMFGHSMGGYVTLAFAEKYSEMLNGLSLFHSHSAADSEKTKENRDRTVEVIKLNHKGFINQFIPDLFAPENVEKFHDEIEELKENGRQTTKESVIAALIGMKERSGKLQFLINTDLPIQFIIGKQDSRIPYNEVLAQAALPKFSEIIILGNAGHMTYLEEKEITLKAVRYFALKCFDK
ncbi:MAG: alpha/beta hydrolase [Bacteroidales bacterium]|nr:alpha/beta hydrolase [Bacteroidales bacterium]